MQCVKFSVFQIRIENEIFPFQKQESISARLHSLTKLLFEDHNYEIEKYYDLEDQWTDVINDNSQVYMSNQAKLQQRAIWEFLVTEKNYIKKLRIIVEVSYLLRGCLDGWYRKCLGLVLKNLKFLAMS